MIVKTLKKCCISNVMDGSHNAIMQNDSEEAGNGSSKCNEERGTTVMTHTIQTTKVQRMTMIGKGKLNLTCFRLCINYVKLTVKYLFLCRHLLGKLFCTLINTFSFDRCVSIEGHLAFK